MPDPRVEEDSSGGFTEQEQQQEQYDLPSTLEYKDQGRNYQDVMEAVSTPRVETTAVLQHQQREQLHDLDYKDQGRDYQLFVPNSRVEAVPDEAVVHQQHGQPYDLPSNIDYKDQGRNYQDVVTAPSAHLGGPIRDLPSNLEYKDLGRDMSSVLPEVTPVIVGHQQELPSNIDYKDQGREFGSIMPQSVTKPTVPYGTPGTLGPLPSSTGGPSATPTPLPPKEEQTNSPQDRKCRYIYFGGAAAVILLAIIVGVAVAKSGGGSSEKDETVSPAISPDMAAAITPNPTITQTLAPTLTPLLWKSATEPIFGETVSEFFGFSVDFSGDASILAVGAYRYDVTSDLEGFDAGQARIFRRNGDTWDPIGRVNGSSPNELYGWAVSLSKNGTILAHGTPYTPNESGERIGSVDVYEFSEPDVWTPIGSALGNATRFSDMGFAVDLNEDGTICAFSYNGDDAFGLPNVGSFEVYQYDSLSEDWLLMGDKEYGEEASDFYGYALRMNYAGDIVASGAGAPSKPSYVKVYRFNDVQQSWDVMGGTIRATFEDDDFNANYFGAVLALSADGLTVVIGAPHTVPIGRPGFVQVFRFNESTNQWDPLGQVIRGQTDGENFGYSVDISADGSVIMIGASQYDGPAFRVGRVDFYEFNSTHWNQLGNSIEGDLPNGDLGFAVSLSADASTGAIGVYRDNTVGLASGKLVIVERDL